MNSVTTMHAGLAGMQLSPEGVLMHWKIPRDGTLYQTAVRYVCRKKSLLRFHRVNLQRQIQLLLAQFSKREVKNIKQFSELLWAMKNMDNRFQQSISAHNASLQAQQYTKILPVFQKKVMVTDTCKKC